MVENNENILPFQKKSDSDESRENVLSKFEKYWRIGKSCDLILDIDGKEFYCHKVILLCASRFFTCLAKYNPDEHDQKISRIKLSSIDPNNMQVILEYIYTGELLNEDNMFDIIYVADYLLLDSMLTTLSITLKHIFTVNNSADYFHLAKEIKCQNIYNAVLRFLTRNIYEMHLNYKLGSFSYEDLLDILKDKRLIIRNGPLFLFGMEFKNYILEIILEWANLDENNRTCMPKLVDKISKYIIESMYDKLKLESYRYIEPISRAYFFNSIPLGRHPPSLVSAPFNFRCLSRNIKRTFIDSPPHKWYIKRIILFIIPDWNNISAIGDIQIDYKNYWTGELQSYRAVMDNYTGYTKEEILLEDNERIIEIDIYHGWMIYGMKFCTSSNRIIGTFGSSDGELCRINFQKDYPNALYLHGFAFLAISSKEWNAINWLTIYGSMIDKDAFYKDFDCAFEADVQNKMNDTKKIDAFCISGNTSTLIFQPENYLNELNYPLPNSIEDLFYQWRRYMRIMRLSVIRRHESNISTMPVDTDIIPSLYLPNLSSPEFSDLNSVREI